MADNISPTRTLEFYLADSTLNQSIHQALEEIGDINELPFFETFYSLIELVKNGQTQRAIDEIKGFKYGGMELFVTYCLRERIRFDALQVENFTNAASSAAMYLLDKEYSRLEALYPPDLFMVSSGSHEGRAIGQVFIFKTTNKFIETLIQKAVAKGEHERAIELRARQDERERIEAMLGETIQAAIAATQERKRNPEHTLKRQVIALGFILKYLGVKNIDKTVQARFIEFLIGKTYKDIYDTLRELDDYVYDKKRGDARFVVEQLRTLGLEEIALEIESIAARKGEEL